MNRHKLAYGAGIAIYVIGMNVFWAGFTSIGLIVMGLAGLPMAGLFKRGDWKADSGHGSIRP